jgi:hypothetical protein
MGKPTKKQQEKSMMSSSSKVIKDFSYAQDDVALNFKLRIDIKDELIIFKKMMEKGIEDIDLELKRLSV